MISILSSVRIPQWIRVVCLRILSWKDWVSTSGIWGHLTYLEPEQGPGNPKKVVNFILGSLTLFSILFPLFIFTPLNWTSESLWWTALWVAERWAERTRLKSQLSSLSYICVNAFQSPRHFTSIFQFNVSTISVESCEIILLWVTLCSLKRYVGSPNTGCLQIFI